MENNTFAPIALSANGIKVYNHPAGHPHRPELLAETISKLVLEGTFCRKTIDLGRTIGKDHLVETAEGDHIVYLRRGNRAGETRMVLKEAADTSFVTIILCVARKDEETPDELVDKWVVVTLFEGQPGEREPWDNSFIDADVDEGVAALKAKSEMFWATHALVPTEEEKKAIENGEAFGPLHMVVYGWLETNPFANPDKANNGGGYSQPEIHLSFSDGTEGVIYDTSCGDFGTRISLILKKGDVEQGAAWGTMENNNCSDIDEKMFMEHLRLIYIHEGYSVPTKQDIEEELAAEEAEGWEDEPWDRYAEEGWDDSDWE